MKYAKLNELDMIWIRTVFAPHFSFKKIVEKHFPECGEMLPIPLSFESLIEVVNANQNAGSFNEINTDFVYSPKSNPLLTIVVSVGGGGQNHYPICSELQCRCLRIRSTPRPELPVYIHEFCFEDISHGDIKLERFVRIMWDDRWDFWEEGDPLPVENLENYKKRRKRDRLTGEDVFDMAVYCGVPLDNPEFYEPADGLMYFWGWSGAPQWLLDMSLVKPKCTKLRVYNPATQKYEVSPT